MNNVFISVVLAADTTANIEKFASGTLYFAIAACIVAILFSSILWAAGSKGQNPGQELTGKKGLIIAVTAAFFLGSIPAIMGFLDVASRGADQNGVISGPAPSNCTLASGHNGTNGC